MTRVMRPKPKRKRRRKGGKRYSLRHAVADGGGCYEECGNAAVCPHLPHNGCDCTGHTFYAPPYEPRVYFFDVEQLGEVVQGLRQPWEVTPYDPVSPWGDATFWWRPQEFWRLPEEDDPNCRHAWGWSSAWDAANSRLFVSQTRAEDFDETIIHVWQIQ